MLLFPLLKFLLLGCTAGWSPVRALRSHRRSVASDNQLVVAITTSPNHLPEEKLSLTTLAPVLTRSSTSMVTTTVARLPPTTTASTVQNSPELNISLTTTVASFTPSSPKFITAPTTTDFTTTPTPTSTTITTSSTTATTTATTTTTTNYSTTELTTGKGLKCNCSADGSEVEDSCDPRNGSCKCLHGYSGLSCEQCSSGYFRNRTGGCQPCTCDSSGAVGPQCNSSGVCECKTGVSGDKCDDCQSGYFNFSSAGCQACQCNNHSSTCDKQSGVCLSCQGNTGGPSCAECKPNFYRERGSSLSKLCLPCPCSIVTSSGTCKLNDSGQPKCDQCNPGYKGFTCVECQDGYYNSDSICVKCNCNGNTEPSSASRICHPDNGECLNCSYNTTGPQCQFCAPGFTRDAFGKNCTAIVPTTPAYYSTMTPSPNVTDQLPTSSTSLLSSLTIPSANSTSSTLSWAQFNVIVLAIIITLILALLGAAGGIYTYRRYQNRKINAPFWTIELKEDNISFSSYHDSLTNADASGLLEDEACEAASNGQLALNSPGSLYMP